ncbi:carbohydrate-binding module family 18 protein [Myriangium duriaei CBS 260.36]|uniref:Carbohydrate-binding module family 18 protein n=1 Tax=Myriangium duriaei CBS 260.36 TaxID=1168546 RepID=A0A9P4MBS9_9PEZI|nr:carbohydrate-binding module family 18 protein [Myriangium duriaei CBS 260.36]
MMMSTRALVVGVAVIAAHAAAQFSLYPPVDPGRLASAFNISSGCLSALNTTVTCDQTLLTMAGTVDNYLWDIDNVTALCTPACLSSTQTWFDNVNGSCFSDTLIFSGREVPPLTIPGRTLDGLNIACLTPTTDVSLDPGVGGSIVTVSNETSSTTSVQKRDASSSGFCLIDSYDWVGSDIIRPDCSIPDAQNVSQCIDPTNVTAENQRLSNLYPDDLLCSNCFINMFYLRVASPYLPDLDYSDYLVEQYYDIIDVCNKQMPDLIVRLTDSYPDAPGFLGSLPINTSSLQPFADGSSTMAPNATANGICPGQTITFNQVANVASSMANPDTAWFCDSLALSFNVSSGDLIQAFQNYGCDVADPTVTNATWCLPQACTVYQVPDNSTCAQIVDAVSTPQSNITVQQLVQYNPHFQGTCDDVPQQYVCITPPGGAYIPPPVSSTTNATQQQRGGGDGSSSVGSGNPAVTIAAGALAPSPTQSGIIANCRVYSNASVGDGCSSFSEEHGINPGDLFAWNSVLGAGGKYCLTQFWLGYWYCIGTDATTTTTPSLPSPTGQPAPGPTQSGIIATCDRYAVAAAGDGCDSFAAKEGITTAQLYAWNPVLGSNGENCLSSFWAKEYYCVHASGPVSSSSSSSTTITTTTTTTPTTTSGSAPGPTQSGIIATCDKYAVAAAGDGCDSFAAKEGITTAQLYAWNAVLGPNGENCLSSFWAKEYYCVHAAPPSPIQSGVIATCNKYAMAAAGDGCYSFAAKEGISTAQLYAWNPVLGANGENCLTSFWANEYYCTGASGNTKRAVAAVSDVDLEDDTEGVLFADGDPSRVWATSLNPVLMSLPLDKRDLPTGTCNSQTPCVNGACCGPDNLCGYTHKQCGTGCRFNCK